MAENEKQAVQTEQTESTKKKETEAEKRERENTEKLNRQINYFIMRHMWQVVRGRKHKEGDTIYADFDTSRERYTRIINTGVVRYGKGELDELELKTGIRRAIFAGQICFDCSYVIKNGTGIVTKSITKDEWEKLFRLRDGRKDNDMESEESYRKYQRSLLDKLKKVPKNNKENRDFYCLCYYLKNRKVAPSTPSVDTIEAIEKAINDLSFNLLDECNIHQLERFQQLIGEKSRLISSMIVYKHAQNESELEIKK